MQKLIDLIKAHNLEDLDYSAIADALNKQEHIQNPNPVQMVPAPPKSIFDYKEAISPEDFGLMLEKAKDLEASLNSISRLFGINASISTPEDVFFLLEALSVSPASIEKVAGLMQQVMPDPSYSKTIKQPSLAYDAGFIKPITTELVQQAILEDS